VPPSIVGIVKICPRMICNLDGLILAYALPLSSGNHCISSLRAFATCVSAGGALVLLLACVGCVTSL